MNSVHKVKSKLNYGEQTPKAQRMREKNLTRKEMGLKFEGASNVKFF